MRTPEHILARNRERRRQREQRRQEEMRQGIRQRIHEREERERRHLHAILEEHRRRTPQETMLALAWSVHELRNNFEQLGRTIGPVLEGKGFIALERWGPYSQQHAQKITGSMLGDVVELPSSASQRNGRPDCPEPPKSVDTQRS